MLLSKRLRLEQKTRRSLYPCLVRDHFLLRMIWQYAAINTDGYISAANWQITSSLIELPAKPIDISWGMINKFFPDVILVN